MFNSNVGLLGRESFDKFPTFDKLFELQKCLRIPQKCLKLPSIFEIPNMSKKFSRFRQCLRHFLEMFEIKISKKRSGRLVGECSPSSAYTISEISTIS